MREPKTASASPVTMRAIEVGENLRRVLPVAVQQHDDVEALVDEVAIAGLLIAAVAKVLLVAEDVQAGVDPETVLRPRASS